MRIEIANHAKSLKIENIPFPQPLITGLTRMGCLILGDLHGRRLEEIGAIQARRSRTIEQFRSVLHKESLGRIITLSPEGPEAASAHLAQAGRYFIPPNARHWPVSSMPMSVRLAKTLKRSSITFVGEIARLDRNELKRARGCGLRTLGELDQLVSSIQSGKFDLTTFTESAAASCLIQSIDEFIGSLPARDREVMLDRYGGHGSAPRTLEAIGRTQKLTRERVRQINDKWMAKLNNHGGPRFQSALHCLKQSALDFSRSNVCPFTPAMLNVWLLQSQTHASRDLKFYLRIIMELEPGTPVWLDLTERPPNPKARLVAQAVIDRLRRSLLPVLARAAFNDLSKSGVLPALTVKDFLESVRSSKSIRLQLKSPSELYLSVSKLHTSSWVRQVLAASPIPLKPEEIVARGALLIGSDFNPPKLRGLENKLRRTGFLLLGPHRYGLRTHVVLPVPMWSKAKADVYALLQKEKRQISTCEIVKARCFKWTVQTNAHELAEILKIDDRFTDLGRFVFGLSESGSEGRKHLADLIVETLKKAGHPLTAAEMIARVKRQRSFSLTTFPAVLRRSPEVRSLGFGYYGLITWDSCIPSYFSGQPKLIERIIRRAGPPYSFGTLCDTLKIDPGGTLARPLWDTLKKMPKVILPKTEETDGHIEYSGWSLEQVIQGIFIEAGVPLLASEIQLEVEKLRRGTFKGKTLDQIESALIHSRKFIRTSGGRFILNSRPEDCAGLDEISREVFTPAIEETSTNEFQASGVGADKS